DAEEFGIIDQGLDQVCVSIEGWKRRQAGREEIVSFWMGWNDWFGNMSYEEYIRSYYDYLGTVPERESGEARWVLVNVLLSRPFEDALRGYQVLSKIEKDAKRLASIKQRVEFLTARPFDRWKGECEVLSILGFYEERLGVTHPYDRNELSRLISNLT